jgi:hypothetical protein
MRTLTTMIAILALGGVAHAATEKCAPLDKFKSAFDAKTKFTQATIGQFHVLEGVYISNPKTPEGLPPGDGALIIVPPAIHGKAQPAGIAWTQHGGKDVCGSLEQVLIVPVGALAMLNKIETGKDEKSQTADDPKDELRL